MPVARARPSTERSPWQSSSRSSMRRGEATALPILANSSCRALRSRVVPSLTAGVYSSGRWKSRGGGTMGGRKVVVLGGGVGGLTAANELRRLLGPQHRVVLIEQEREHRFAPSFLWVMTGARRREQVTLELSTIVHSGVELIQAQVQSIDPERKAVVAGGTEHRYDALVVALGAELDPASFPGYTDAVHGFFDLDGAAGLADALRAFAGGRVIVAVTALPYKCPAAPYEAALLIEDHLRRRGVRERSEIVVFTPEPQPMPVAGPVLGAAV